MQRLLNPLEDVQEVADDFAGRFRRALSVEEIERLLQVAPVHRAVVYQQCYIQACADPSSWFEVGRF